MDFGKLPSIENVDFSLPDDAPGNAAVLQKSRATDGEQTLYIGATGWGMKEWVGTLYPKGAKANEFLSHYARHFNTIEFNSTHYATPDAAAIRRWCDQTTDDFRFCPKVLQRISHSRGLLAQGPSELLGQFCEAILEFGEKMGVCFLQLPPHFGPDHLPQLAVFLEKWNASGLPIAVEVRHENWFDDGGDNLERLAAVLEQNGAATVITDVAGRRDVCHARLTTDSVVVRFVGNGPHPTDFSRMDAWTRRLALWYEGGLKNAYFFVHQPDNGEVPVLAAHLAKKMKSMLNVTVRGPLYMPDTPEAGQLSLF